MLEISPHWVDELPHHMSTMSIIWDESFLYRSFSENTCERFNPHQSLFREFSSNGSLVNCLPQCSVSVDVSISPTRVSDTNFHSKIVEVSQSPLKATSLNSYLEIVRYWAR